MNALQTICGLFLAFTVGYSVWGYPRKYGALSGRSRLFRTIGIGLIDLLLFTVFVYLSTNWEAQRLQVGMGPTRAAEIVEVSQLLFYCTWLLLGVILMGIAMLDGLENFTIYRRSRREAMEEMIAGAVEAHRKKKLELQTEHGGNNDGGGSVA